MSLLLTVVLIVLLFGGGIGTLPSWGYSSHFGYGPSGILFTLLIILVVLAICGRI